MSDDEFDSDSSDEGLDLFTFSSIKNVSQRRIDELAESARLEGKETETIELRQLPGRKRKAKAAGGAAGGAASGVSDITNGGATDKLISLSSEGSEASDGEIPRRKRQQRKTTKENVIVLLSDDIDENADIPERNSEAEEAKRRKIAAEINAKVQRQIYQSTDYYPMRPPMDFVMPPHNFPNSYPNSVSASASATPAAPPEDSVLVTVRCAVPGLADLPSECRAFQLLFPVSERLDRLIDHWLAFYTSVAFLTRSPVLRKEELCLRYRKARIFNSSTLSAILGAETVKKMPNVALELLTVTQHEAAELEAEFEAGELFGTSEGAEESFSGLASGLASGSADGPGGSADEPNSDYFPVKLKGVDNDAVAVQVTGSTKLAKLAEFYRTQKKIPAEKNISLMFDDELLDLEESVESTELEEGFLIDVIVK